MNGNRTNRIINLELALNEEHCLDDNHTCNGSKDRCDPRINKRTWCGDDHETSKHAVGHHGGVWLTGALPDPQH